MVKGFSVYKDVVPPGRGNVPYLPEVMIAATAVSRQVCRDAEEGAEEEGGINLKEEGTLPGTTGEGRSEAKTGLLLVETGQENVPEGGKRRLERGRESTVGQRGG